MEIDFTQHLGAVKRRLSTREVDGAEARVITMTRTYRTTPEDLWNAITDAERLPKWFVPVSGDFKEGGSYQITGNASGTILKCAAPKELNLTWAFGENVSWVNIQLSETGDGTEFVLEHIAHVPQEFWEEYGPGAAGAGWDLALLGLGEHLESGSSFDPQEAMIWPGTENGKAFVQAISAAWGEAAIEAGDEAEWAHSAAERTYKFYTGT